MAFTSGKRVFLVAMLLVGVLVVWAVQHWSTRRQWFDLQDQQLATIRQLENFPPQGCSKNVWKNVLITPYNVWGNVIYDPDYSQISNEEMRLLKLELEKIVAETDSENGFESVDRVFQLLLQRGRNTASIAGYRDEILQSRKIMEQDSAGIEPVPTEEPPAAAR